MSGIKLTIIVLMVGAALAAVWFLGLSGNSGQESGTEKLERLINELEVAREDLQLLEQKIQGLKRENQPFEIEAEALANTRQNIIKLQQQIAPLKAEKTAGSTAEGKTGIAGLLAGLSRFLGVIFILVVGVALFMMIRSFKSTRTPVQPARSMPPVQSQTGAREQQALNELQKTIEQFKKIKSVNTAAGGEKETDLNINVNQASSVVGMQASGPVDPAPPAEDVAPRPSGPAAAHQGAAQEIDKAQLVETVFKLNEQGMEAKEISEKLRLPFDQVSLILRFKH